MPPQSASVPRRRSFETGSVWALIITLVVAVFIFIPSISVPFTTTKTFALAAGALITLALYILARLSRGNIILPPFILLGALWLPALAYLLSSVFSGVPFTSALWGLALEPDTLGFILVAVVLGTLAALVLRRPEHYKLFLRVGAWAFGIYTLVQILIVLIGQAAPNFVAPSFALVGSPQDLAYLLGLGVAGTLLTLRFLDLAPQSHKLLIASGVGALALLAVSNSSLVWTLLALISLGLFVEAVMRRNPKAADAELDDVALASEAPVEEEGGSRPLVLPLAVLAISLFFLIGSTLGNALASSLNVSALNVRPSWGSTLSVAHDVYGTAPVFGSGPGTFGVEWLKNRSASLNSTVFWNIDFTSGIGFIPTSFVTTGIVGAIAWLALFVLFLYFGLRMLIMRTPEDSFVRFTAILSFIAMLYLFVIAIFGLPDTVILALAFVFAGVFASTMRFAARGGQWGVVFSRSPRIGFVIVFFLTLLLLSSVVAAYTLVERYVASVELTAANAAYAAGNLDAATQAAQGSTTFAPTATAYELEAVIESARLGQIASSSTMPAAQAQQAFQASLSAGIGAALTATQIAPADYKSWLVLGNLYAQAVPLNVSGAYASAKDAYQKAENLNPTNPAIPYTLAQLDIANKDMAAAQTDLKAAIALKQDYVPAILLLSQLEVQTGNVKDALSSAEAAAYFTPNDPNVLFQVGILRAAQNDLPGAAQALAAAVAANPQFANARYFLAAVYAKQGDYKDAVTQVEAIAALSDTNAKAVAAPLTALQAGKDPFPANLLAIPAAPTATAPTKNGG
ncbi:MAG TPA: tetratricopeptide repeat protein [Candidatus Paceibacterota bacterium]|nr:tetratricopeptide repeat protein [Candidatus Paceibacterota bacterium]